MKTDSLDQRLAVCSWSLQPADLADLVAQLQSVGILHTQIALDPLRQSPQVWGQTHALCHEQGVTVVSGMFGCVGEDYSTLESIRRTGGVAPDATWAENLRNIEAEAALAAELGLDLVTFHAGFLPHEETDPAFARMLERLGILADLFARRRMTLALETGQETAQALRQILVRLDRANVGVNFDPANMILYDKGNPIEAVSVLGPWIRQVHIKDATRTRTPGTWGEEVAVGSGEVDWPAFFAALKAAGFQGQYVIEREAGRQRGPDIRRAREIALRAFSNSHT